MTKFYPQSGANGENVADEVAEVEDIAVALDKSRVVRIEARRPQPPTTTPGLCFN